MMRKYQIFNLIMTVFILISSAFSMTGATYRYTIDLVNPENNRIHIRLSCDGFSEENITYHFPKTVPGTYKEADYGRLVKSFEAFDSAGNALAVKKEGKNSFIISGAADLNEIDYWLAPSWDQKRSLKIWPMAGTGFSKDNYFALSSGAFGYFEGEKLNPVELTFKSPDHLYPMTVLDKEIQGDGIVRITARDYHHLVDCPIMFAAPDTTSFNIRGTYVEVGVKRQVEGEAWAEYLHTSLEPAMAAIGGFLDSLPVERYSYILFFRDDIRLGEILEERFLVPKAIGYILKNGLPAGGALEHNTSSFYYLPDLGPRFQTEIHEMVGDIAIHEFMHIITPLNLHSEHISDFNYADPIMSKHLWLYEGVTEYFAGMIQVHGDMMTPKRYITRTLRAKIRRGEEFANDKMSFTEMSENVFEKKYKKEYLQVYQRGAAMGALLDIEIIRLSEGEMTLIDVLMELINRYGPEVPFPEDSFIDELCEIVHPDLRDFFARYVEGQEDLPYAEILEHVGVEYADSVTEPAPRHPIDDNRIKPESMSIGKLRTIKKVGKKDWIGFQTGDQYDRGIYYDHYMDDMGHYFPEGSVVDIEIVRDGKPMTLPDTVKYTEREQTHRLRMMPDPTPDQVYYFNVWMGFQEPGSDFVFPGLPGDSTSLEEGETELP